MSFNFETESKEGTPLRWIAVFNIRDENVWKLALSLLEHAKLDPVAEGGVGHLEIAVKGELFEQALALLKSEPRLRDKNIRWAR